MRRWLKKGTTVLAIYAIALHVILFGFAPLYGNGAVDPFSVICHGAAAATPGGEKQPDPHLIPGHACEHCNLCSAAEPPSPPDIALAGSMGPVRILHVLRPASTTARRTITSDPKSARGPPRRT